jgi:hypothetical protein
MQPSRYVVQTHKRRRAARVTQCLNTAVMSQLAETTATRTAPKWSHLGIQIVWQKHQTRGSDKLANHYTFAEPRSSKFKLK